MLVFKNLSFEITSFNGSEIYLKGKSAEEWEIMDQNNTPTQSNQLLYRMQLELITFIAFILSLFTSSSSFCASFRFSSNLTVKTVQICVAFLQG
jgi:hypothetical protein